MQTRSQANVAFPSIWPKTKGLDAYMGELYSKDIPDQDNKTLLLLYEADNIPEYNKIWKILYQKIGAKRRAELQKKKSEVSRFQKALGYKRKTIRQIGQKDEDEDEEDKMNVDEQKQEEKVLNEEAKYFQKKLAVQIASMDQMERQRKTADLDASANNLKKVHDQVKNDAVNLVDVIKQVIYDQEEDNKKNKRPLQFGLIEFQQVLESSLLGSDIKADKASRNLKQLIEFIADGKGKVSENINVLAQQDQLADLEEAVLERNMWLPLIVKDDIDPYKKYHAATRTELKNKAKIDWGNKVSEAIDIAEADEHQEATYKDGLLVGKVLQGFCLFIEVAQQMLPLTKNALPNAMKAFNYRPNDWRKAEWVDAIVGMQQVGLNNFKPRVRIGNTPQEDLASEIIKIFDQGDPQNTHFQVGGDNVYHVFTENLVAAIPTLAVESFQSGMNEKFYPTHTTKPLVPFGDNPNAAIKKFYNENNIYLGTTTIGGMMLTSKQWLNKFTFQIQRGYKCRALKYGAIIKNNNFKCMIVTVQHRFDASASDFPIYCLQQGASIKLPQSGCDLDDNIVIIGINPNLAGQYRELNVPGIPKFTPFKSTNPDIAKIQTLKGFILNASCSACVCSVVFSGLFNLNQVDVQRDPSLYKEYDPKHPSKRINMKMFRDPYAKTITGTIRSQDSAIMILDDKSYARFDDELFEFKANKLPETLQRDPYDEFNQFKKVMEQNVYRTVKIQKLANLIQAALQPTTSKMFRKQVGTYMKERNLNDLGGSNRDIIDKMQTMGVDIREFNNAIDDFGLDSFLTKEGEGYRASRTTFGEDNIGYIAKYQQGYKRKKYY